jgi:putative sigma-54 modulation protein
MEIEYTGRQVEITDELRAQAEAALTRIEKLAGQASAANVVFTAEKHRHTAEVRVLTKLHELIGLSEASTVEAALKGALDKAEAQAIRQKEKLKARNHSVPSEKSSVQPGLERASHAMRTALPMVDAPGVSGTAAPETKAPAGVPRSGGEYEPHIVRTIDAIALRPMTLEEAVKEAEARDREVFVFRDGGDQIKILHRTCDGRMELIELP